MALLRRIAIAVVGGLLTLAGIILLVLPGPGFVLVAAGLAVLAREFTWAAKPLHMAEDRAQQGLTLVAERMLFAVLDGLVGAGLIIIAVIDLTVGIPYLETVSDVFMIGGGLFLLGSIVWARTGHARQTVKPA